MFAPSSSQPHRASAKLLTALAALLASSLWFSSAARAQNQENGLLDRIDHPDRTLRFDPADKKFGVSAVVGDKQAQVKSFSFGKQSAIYGGDGAFRTKAFSSKDSGFKTEAYAAKASALSQRNSFAQADKGFGTKPMDVREAPAANKSAAVRDYVLSEKPYNWRGKRQDTMDEVTKDNKNLTVDQVRELLNKGPAGRP